MREADGVVLCRCTTLAQDGAARRNGLGVDELVSIIQEVAAEEDEESSRPAAANRGEQA